MTNMPFLHRVYMYVYEDMNKLIKLLNDVYIGQTFELLD